MCRPRGDRGEIGLVRPAFAVQLRREQAFGALRRAQRLGALHGDRGDGGLGPPPSQPSYALGITRRDNGFYREWDGISRDRERFTAWMQEHVIGAVAA